MGSILLTGSMGFVGTYIKNNINITQDIILGTTSDVSTSEYTKFDSLYSDIDIVLNKKIDCIIHAASIIPVAFNDANYDIFLNNIHMMQNLTKFATNNDVKKFIYISSFGSIVNTKSLDIGDYYTMAKITGEHFCALMARSGISAVSFRVSSPFGEYYRKKNVISIFVENAIKNKDIIIYGSGQRRQNFVYAGDLLSAIELALTKDKLVGTYNIVGNKSISMLELAKIIIKITKSKSRIVFYPDHSSDHYCAKYSYKKAQLDFGYVPKINIEQGIKRYIEWIKSENSHHI